MPLLFCAVIGGAPVKNFASRTALALALLLACAAAGCAGSGVTNANAADSAPMSGADAETGEVRDALLSVGYAGAALSETERSAYMQICFAAAGLELHEKFTLDTPLEYNAFRRVCESVYGDKPQLEWMECVYSGQLVKSFELRANVDDDLEKLRERETEKGRGAAQMLDGLWDIPKPQAAVLAHDRLLKRLEYGGGDSDEVYSALVLGRGLCGAYSRTYQYLMTLLGIECVRVDGTSVRGIPHSWVKVRLDGEWYCVDPTWDDTAPDREYIFHDYLLVPDEMLEKTHFPASKQYVQIPKAAGERYDYYRQKGLCIEPRKNANEQERDFADAFSRGLAAADNSPEGRLFLEVRLFGSPYQQQRMVTDFRSRLYSILETMAKTGERAIETTGKVLFDYNDVTRVLTMRPLLTEYSNGRLERNV